jgi:hypothetical protein
MGEASSGFSATMAARNTWLGLPKRQWRWFEPSAIR